MKQYQEEKKIQDSVFEYIKEKQIKSTQSSFLSELNKATPGTKVDFYFTSLYDYSLFESFSCIFQINMQKNYYFSGLINSFAIKSKFEKTYLFDYVNKIYLATNSTPGEKSLFSSCLAAIINLYELSKNYSNEEDIVINQNCKSIFTLNNFSKNNDSTYLLYVAFLFNNLVLFFFSSRPSNTTISLTITSSLLLFCV